MYQKHGDIIYSADIERRIEQLWDRADGVPVADWFDEERDEYNELAGFRQQVQGEYGHGAWHRGISFVSEEYKSAYANEQADDLFGEDVTRQRAWSDEIWEEDFYADWRAFELDDTEYLTDGHGIFVRTRSS